jgi:hypothetical protein
MKIFNTKVFVLACAASFCTTARSAPFLQCNSHESSIFDCRIQAKQALLCASNTSDLSYRYQYGSIKGLEFTFPTMFDKSKFQFRLASIPTPNGNVSYIHFSNYGYEYYLVDDSSKNSDGSFSPVSRVVVLKNMNVVKNSICENDDSGIAQSAYSDLPRETFFLPQLNK